MSRRFVVSVALAAAIVSVAAKPKAPSRDAVAARWVEKTLASITLDEKIGQMRRPVVRVDLPASDSEEFARLADLVTLPHVGGFIVFGGTEPAPPVLLNSTYGTVILGQPLEAAATLNRLQRLSKLPLLNAADFEFGVGMRIAVARSSRTRWRWGHRMIRRSPSVPPASSPRKSRAIGVHVDFAPVADVNNNPRNPVINTRSFGEDPAKVGAMVAAFVRGLKAGGVTEHGVDLVVGDAVADNNVYRPAHLRHPLRQSFRRLRHDANSATFMSSPRSAIDGSVARAGLGQQGCGSFGDGQYGGIGVSGHDGGHH